MKGTARLTGNELKDLKIYQELALCDKNRAENLIIVDLLRNDLSAIAKTHTVKVDKLFSIEKYKNLLQMTSQISAKVDKQISFRKILDGLFPCGSITGAPKKRTMELIKQIEKGKREFIPEALAILCQIMICALMLLFVLFKNIEITYKLA